MNDEPQTWHYGLMAERWGLPGWDLPELPTIKAAIARFGQPVLDLACGSGRLLLPLLQAGTAIEGCDISADMLAQCRAQAQAEGLEPTLYQQPMHAFDLPRRYKTIYLCDSFGLAGSREKDLQTLRRCYEHLQDGGALLLNIQAEYADQDAWNEWLPPARGRLPEEWPEEGSQRDGLNGEEHVAYFRTVSFDPLEQCFTREVRLEKWQDGRLLASETYALRGSIYFKPEVLLMLRLAGFRDISVTGDYTGQPASADHSEIIFTAVK